MILIGERLWAAEPQPRGREPAPGELALVQSFLNSRWDLQRERAEVLVSGEALAGWLSTRGLLEDDRRLTDADLARALAVREGLRAMAFSNLGHPLDESTTEAMRRASEAPSLLIRLAPGGPRLFANTDAGLDGAIGLLYGIVALAMADGAWQRLKACPGHRCGWVFYDRSRNQSARWCAMQICGDQEKARAYYRRKMQGSPR
ncbi:MAG: CGNR zinc finger domain-containing protein [Gaiellaceae bacterium]